MITDQLKGSSGVTGSNGIALEKQLKELQATVAAMSQFIGTYKINAVQANLQEANIPALTFVQGNGSNLALTGQLNFNQATGEHGYIKRLSVDNIQVLNAQESEGTYKDLTVLSKAKIKELEVDRPMVNLQVTNLSTNRTQTETAEVDTATVNYATVLDGAIEGSVKFGTAGQMINSAGQVVFVDNGSTVNVGSTNRAIQFNSTIRPKWGNVSLAIEGDGTSAFSYKGSVEDVTDLQALISTSAVGDTYMVQQIGVGSGANPGIAIFNGTTFDLTIYYLLANYRTSAEQDEIDTATRQMISSEATTREHADANLQSQITSNKNEADVAIAALQAKDLLHDGLIQANTDAIDYMMDWATTEEANLQTQIDGKVGNAPVDGVPYCRKDGAWVDVTEEVQGLNREYSGQSVVTSLSNDDDGFKVTSSAPMTVTTAPDNAADVDLDKVVTKGYIDTNLNLSKADDDWRQHHGDQLTIQLMSGAFSPDDVSYYYFNNNRYNNGIDQVKSQFCYDGKEWFYAARYDSATVIASNPSKGKQRVLSFDGFGSPSYTAEAVQLYLHKVNAHYTGDAAGVVYVSCNSLAQSNIFFALKDGKILGGMKVGATTPATYPSDIYCLPTGVSARNHSAVWLPRTGSSSGYFENTNATYGYILGMNDLGEEDVLAAKKFDFPATGNWGAYGNQAAGNENVWFPNANYNENYRILCCKPDGTTGVFNVLSADAGTVGAPITHTRLAYVGTDTSYISSTAGKRTFTDSNGNVWGTFYGTLNNTPGAFIYRCDDTLQDNEPIKAWRLTTKGSDNDNVHAFIGQEFTIEEVGDYIYVFSPDTYGTANTTTADSTPNYYRILKSGNSAPQALTKAGAYRMGAICNRGFDNEGNLWVTYSGAIGAIEKIGLDGSITTVDTNTGNSVNWGRMAWADVNGGGRGKGNSVFQMADGTLVILGFDGAVSSSTSAAKILKVMTIKNGTFAIHNVNHTIFNATWTAVPIGNAIFFAPSAEATTVIKQGTFAMFFNGTNTPIYRKFTSFGGRTINSSRVQPWWNLVYHDLAAGNGCKAFTMNKLDLLPVMFTATYGRGTTTSPDNWAIPYGYWKIDSDIENDVHLRDNEKVLSTITL